LEAAKADLWLGRPNNSAVSTSTPTLAHLVFLRSGLLLSKRRYSSWREIQDEFDGYHASLGPWTAEEIRDYFEHDYSADDSRWPLSRDQLAAFFASNAEVVRAA
jgi:hypothetical protein